MDLDADQKHVDRLSQRTFRSSPGRVISALGFVRFCCTRPRRGNFSVGVEDYGGKTQERPTPTPSPDFLFASGSKLFKQTPPRLSFLLETSEGQQERLFGVMISRLDANVL